MVQTEKRVAKWDNLKFILIFLVVLGHLCDYYTDRFAAARGIYLFIYSFHMPLFLFVSGMFSKRNIDEKRYSNIFSYLILYFFIKFIIYLTSGKIPAGVGITFFSENNVPWYAFALFTMSLVTILLRNVSPVYVLVCSVIFSCFIGYDENVSTFLMLSRLVVFYPFFYLGYAADNREAYDFLQKKNIKIISAVILIVFLAVIIIENDSMYWIRILLTGQSPYKSLKFHPKFGGLYRLGYYAVSFLISAAVASLVPEKLFGTLGAKLGSRTIQVFSLHYCFVNIFRIFFYPKTAHLQVGWIIVLVFALSVLITAVCSLKFISPLFTLILSPEKRKRKPPVSK